MNTTYNTLSFLNKNKTGIQPFHKLNAQLLNGNLVESISPNLSPLTML